MITGLHQLKNYCCRRRQASIYVGINSPIYSICLVLKQPFKNIIFITKPNLPQIFYMIDFDFNISYKEIFSSFILESYIIP